jgi:hypothetical protein
MRTYFLILGFILTYNSSQGQESILKFEPGKQYQLYFIDVLVRDDEDEKLDSIRNGVVRWDNSNSFLLNDESSLNSLQKNWTGKRTNEFYFCWYNYFIYVVEDGKIVDEMRVNEECKQVVCKRGVFNYENTIADKLDRSRIVSVARIKFDSISVGRQFHGSIQKDSNVFSPPGEYDEWITYDGEMVVTVTTNRKNDKKIQNRVKKDIKEQFPHEAFDIQQTGSGPDHLDYRIYCSRNLGENLKGYKGWLNWKELDPSVVTLFSSSKASIESALKKYAR